MLISNTLIVYGKRISSEGFQVDEDHVNLLKYDVCLRCGPFNTSHIKFTSILFLWKAKESIDKIKAVSDKLVEAQLQKAQETIASLREELVVARAQVDKRTEVKEDEMEPSNKKWELNSCNE